MNDVFQYCFEKNDYIQKQLEGYFSLLRVAMEENFGESVSILLVGSLSRGEGTWVRKSDKTYLVSDIEYFVIIEDRTLEKLAIKNIIDEVNNSFFVDKQAGSFHIDYTFMSKSEIPYLEKKLMVFEAKKFGKTIVGSDFSYLFPEVTINNINFFDLKDIISHRLFSMIYYGEKCKSSEQEYIYLLAKNSLDLMTVYLANRGILEGGFFPRYKKLCQVCQNTNLIHYFGQCLDVKMGHPERISLSTKDMKNVFCTLCDELYNETHIPFLNYCSNFKRRLRRLAGVLKRSVKNHTITTFKLQFLRLSKCYKECEIMDFRMIKKHYVLYGYPEEAE